MIIEGKKLAEEILVSLKDKRSNYKKLKIAAFLIGKDNEKINFLKIKQKFAKELNIEFKIYEIDENLGRKKIRKYISEIVKHKTIKGAIIQLPLPKKLSQQYFLNTIPLEKDIDCLSVKSLGKFYTDTSFIKPPAVEVVDFLKNKYNLDFTAKEVLIVGYGTLIGKPLVHYFAKEKATVIIANEKTNLEKFLTSVEVIVSGVGKPGLINDCKKGAILIDFGYSVINNRIYGDLNFEKLKNKAFLITPTPNGTGPILVAKIFENLFKLLENLKSY